jgi:Polyketide cyclase / dehydrase and lipid transport
VDRRLPRDEDGLAPDRGLRPMAVRPDPEVGYRRAGDHLRGDRLVERRVFVQASPRTVWASLHDPSSSSALFPELRLGPAAPSWPAAATTRTAITRLGLLRELARVESLEARPESIFRLRVTGSGFESEWLWRLEPIAGGTRVIHAATFEPIDRWTDILVRLGRRSLEARVEAHLRALKERAERAEHTPPAA